MLPGDVLVPCLYLTHGDASEAVQTESDLHRCFKVRFLRRCLLVPTPFSGSRSPWQRVFHSRASCVSVVAAAAERRQTQSGAGSTPEGQGSCRLFPAVRRHFVQPQLVVCLSVRGTGRARCESRPHHPHCPAAESNQHSATAAPARRLSEGVSSVPWENDATPEAAPLMRDARVCRFLTMDQTRKLLLLLESDPKACSLPLVGL